MHRNDHPTTWDALDRELARTAGTVSVYAGRLDATPAYTRAETVTHYAASTMKVAVLGALHRAAEDGDLDPDRPVPVHNEFDSAQPGAPRFGCTRHGDSDPEVWARLGGTASPRWLARRMVVRSSNLATNLVLAHVGLDRVNEVWTLAGARHSRTGRGIEDAAARVAGIDNPVTAADLAALFGAIATGSRVPGPLAGPAGCAAMLDVLAAQEHRDDLAAGLPPGTRVPHKSGWVHGVRHTAGVVYPDDAPPYLLAVCTTGVTGPAESGSDVTGPGGSAGGAERHDDDPAGADRYARRLIARVSALAWARRHELSPASTD